MDYVVDFLYGANWRRFVDEKCVKMPKIKHFWAKTRRGYRYQLSGTGTRMEWAIGTGTVQISTGTDWQWVTGIGTDL